MVVDRLPAHLQLALVLAIEAEAGDKSFWWPYISCIETQPAPNGWALSKEAVERYLDKAGLLADIPDWEDRFEQAVTAIEGQVKVLREGWGRALGIKRDRLRWAIGHVLSRCFGDSEVVGLAPFIDLFNHSSHASPPEGSEGAEGAVVMNVVAKWGDEPRDVDSGEEVFISYVARTDPMTAFLSFGFIPEELLPHKPDPNPILP